MSEIEKMRLIALLRMATGRATIERMNDDDWREAERLVNGLQKLIRNQAEGARAARYQSWRRRPHDDS